MSKYQFGSIVDRNFRLELQRMADYISGMGYTYEESLRRAHEILDEAQQTNDINESVQQQINTLIAESGTSDAEVLQARIDADGNEYSVLKERLDAQDEDVLFTRKTSSAHPEDLWNPPEQPDIHSYFSNGDAFERHLYSKWLSLFDELMNGNSNYISKEIKGVVYQDRYDFPVYKFTPENGYSKKIIIGAGMHGGEKLAVISLYKFLKHLCEDWKDNKELTRIRHNVQLIVMPFQNPYGIAYNTRKVHDINADESLDINRNFDYKWEKSSSDDPENGNYKGSEPFQVSESNYIREILEEHSDAIAYLDFHNMSEVGLGEGYSTTSYIPKNQPFEVSYLEKLKHALNSRGDDYEINAMDTATAYNYAINNFDMHSFCPEYLPGHNATAYSEEDMTFALKWYGNIIVRFSLLEKDASFLKDKQALIYGVMGNRTTANAYEIPVAAGHSTDNHEVIPQLNSTYHPKARGFMKVMYNIVYSSSDPEAFVYFSPKVWQQGNTVDFAEDSPKSFYVGRFGMYAKGAPDRNAITLIAYMPVDPSNISGYVFLQLMAYVTTGEATILRAQRIYEFIPSEHEDRVTATSR